MLDIFNVTSTRFPFPILAKVATFFGTRYENLLVME